MPPINTSWIVRCARNHLFGWSWVPENGSKATLSADSMAMVSNKFFKAYYDPYLKEMGQRLGKLTIHSCGNFSQVMKSLGAISEVHAVNAGQMSPQQVCEAGWDTDKMMIIDNVKYQNIPELASYMRENSLRAEFRVSKPLDRDGNIIEFSGKTWDEDWHDKMMECTKRLTEVLDADRWKEPVLNRMAVWGQSVS